MGWTFGWKSKGDLIRELLDEPGFTVKAKATTSSYGETRLWVAYERPDGSRFVALFLIERARGEWGYKEMSEAAGPVALDCPLSVLNLAGPDTSDTLKGYAREWRLKVRQYWAAQAA